MEELFHKLAIKTAALVGGSLAFMSAISLIIVWAISGPFFNYSNTWQLFINTWTTIVTFLMVFLIQNTQNRDSRAMHLKLDELIKAMSGARTSMVNIEELSDEELEKLQQEFRIMHEQYSQEVVKRKGSVKVTQTHRLIANNRT